MAHKIVIGVITLYRPTMLAQLLDSLARQVPPRDCAALALVLVDNDDKRSAQAVFDRMAASMPFPATYLVEAQRGIPFARNRILEFAGEQHADYVAFIDDDEIAPPDWAAELYEAITTSGADAVQGPVRFLAEPGSPRWMQEELAARSAKQLELPEGAPKSRLSTRNLIMSLRLANELGLRFDAHFALSGGSDVDYFHRARLRGAKLAWTNRGMVQETIPQSRMALKPQLLRAFRSAAGTTDSLRRTRGFPVAVLKTLPKMLEALLKALVALLFRGGLYSRRGFVAFLGNLSRTVGFAAGLFSVTGQEYRKIQGY